MSTAARLQPLLAARHVVARVALSDPPGWTYFAFSPLLVNVGTGPAWDVRLSLHPVDQMALGSAGCRLWSGTPAVVPPRRQEGEAEVIAVERELAEGLHVQRVAAGNIPPDAWAIAIPDERLEELPDGWLPIFETAQTSVDLDRPGRWECGIPSDLVYGVCTYSFELGRDPGRHDHFVALPFNHIYLPAGWTPPPCLVDTDGN